MNNSLLTQLPLSPSDKIGWPWTEETNPNIYQQKKDWPKISIVTPSYNQGQFIEETIRSILLQNYPNLEYIIMDGGSNDGTVDIIKKYAPWITFWTSEKDNGQTHAINKGLSKCTGEFFNWVNSDDYLTPEAFYKLMVYVLDTTHPLSMISGDILILHENGKTERQTNERKNIFYKYMAGIAVHQPATLFSTQAIKLSGPLNEALHYSMCLHTMLNVNLVGAGAYINEDIIIGRLHSGSKSVAFQNKFYLDRIKTYAIFFGHIPQGYKNERLINLLQSITNENFSAIDKPIDAERFSPEDYRIAQLFIAATIARLYYKENHIDATKKIIYFIKKDDKSFYKKNKLYVLALKTNRLICFLRKIKTNQSQH